MGAWPVPCAPSGDRGEVAHPLAPVWLPSEVGPFPGTRMVAVETWPVPWIVSARRGTWLVSSARLAAVGAWPVPWVQYGRRGPWPIPWGPSTRRGGEARPLGPSARRDGVARFLGPI